MPASPDSADRPRQRASIHFPYPEMNMIEIYRDTPWYLPQPHSVPIDCRCRTTRSWRRLKSTARDIGFMPLAEWQAEVERRLHTSREHREEEPQ
jgi:hypothetical protein